MEDTRLGSTGQLAGTRTRDQRTTTRIADNYYGTDACADADDRGH